MTSGCYPGTTDEKVPDIHKGLVRRDRFWLTPEEAAEYDRAQRERQEKVWPHIDGGIDGLFVPARRIP